MNKTNDPILYMLDEEGRPKEVKVIRDLRASTVDDKAPVPLPEFRTGLEFSMGVDPDAFKQLEQFLKDHDREILEAYNSFAKALECCMQDIRRCRECPLKESESCRGLLLHNVMQVLLNHKKLHRQIMLRNWVTK